MNFPEFSTQFVPIVDAALDEALDFDCSDARQVLKEAIVYSSLAPGKRIRPLLSLATYSLFSSEYTKILPVACAIEMVHTYSLIHDDLPAMDNDDFRRGRPTCHKQFGDDIAILAGDTLVTYAFEYLSIHLPRHFSGELSLAAIAALGRSFGIYGMAGGQVLDLKIDLSSRSLEHLKQIHALKTGAVLQSCVDVPAMLGQASSDEADALNKYGHHLGLLFQITDDILDVVGDPEALGKSPGKDEAQDKLTYVTLLGLDKAKTMAETEANAALLVLEKIDKNTDTLRNIVRFVLSRTH